MKKIEEYTHQQWEDICTRCGKCCLIKLEDEQTGQICYTNVICKYFDLKNHLCRIYDKRTEIVPECLKLCKNNIRDIPWMPSTCAYLRLLENKPPVCSKPLDGRVVSEEDINMDDIEDYIVDWKDL